MAGLLLDTHVVIWWLEDPRQLSDDARERIASPDSDVFVSAVVAWEMAIKSARGKLDTPDDLEESVADAGFIPLTITLRHGLGVRDLPPIHQDPFDRLMISQAVIEGLTVVSRDRQVLRYPVPTVAA